MHLSHGFIKSDKRIYRSYREYFTYFQIDSGNQQARVSKLSNIQKDIQ